MDNRLVLAAKEGDEDKVIRLLESGVDVDAPGVVLRVDGQPDGSTALIAAAIKGHVEIVRTLINYGADVNRVNNLGVAPLEAAVRGLHFKDEADTTAHKRHASVISLLIDSGAYVDVTQPNNGNTPLHEAALSGYTAIVEELLRHGADVNAMNVNGETPLTWAKEMDEKKGAKADIVRLLLDAGGIDGLEIRRQQEQEEEKQRQKAPSDGTASYGTS